MLAGTGRVPSDAVSIGQREARQRHTRLPVLHLSVHQPCHACLHIELEHQPTIHSIFGNLRRILTGGAEVSAAGSSGVSADPADALHWLASACATGQWLLHLLRAVVCNLAGNGAIPGQVRTLVPGDLKTARRLRWATRERVIGRCRTFDCSWDSELHGCKARQ